MLAIAPLECCARVFVRGRREPLAHQQLPAPRVRRRERVAPLPIPRPELSFVVEVLQLVRSRNRTDCRPAWRRDPPPTPARLDESFALEDRARGTHRRPL